MTKPSLASGPVWRPLLALTIPGIGTGLLYSLSSTVNMLWVGRLLGPAAISATANAHLVLGIVASLPHGIATAAGILVGQAIGGGDPRQVQAIVGTNLSLFVLASVAMAAAGMLGSRDLVQLLSLPAEARDDGAIYLRLAFAAFPLAALLSLMISVLHGAGDGRTPLAIMGVLVTVDALANPVLILGLFGLPRMGIAGSGAAYVAAHLVALWLILVAVWRSPRWHHLLPRHWHLLKIDRGIMLWCVGRGSIVGMQYLVIAAVSVGLMGLVNRFGAITSAAYGIAATIWSYVQLPIMAVSGAASSITAHSVGAGLWPRIQRTAVSALAISLVISSISISACYAFNAQIMELFMPGNGPAVRTATGINRIVLWSFLMLAISTVLFGVLRAVGKVWVPFAVICVSHVGVRVPFAYFLAPHWGERAIWWSYPAGLLVALVLTSIYVGRHPPWKDHERRGRNASLLSVPNELWKGE